MRRRFARFMALVLIAGLALSCCACMRLSDHRCDHGPRCPICECVRLGLRASFMPALAMLVIAAPLARVPATAVRRAAGRGPTPIDEKVRLND